MWYRVKCKIYICCWFKVYSVVRGSFRTILTEYNRICIFINLIHRIKDFWLSIYEVSDIFISQCTGDIAQVFIAKGMCVINKTKLIQHHVIKWKFFQGVLTSSWWEKYLFATQNKNHTVLFFIRAPYLLNWVLIVT